MKNNKNNYVKNLCEIAEKNIDWTIYNNKCTIIYIKMEQKKINNMKYITDKLLIGRIDMDYVFDTYNPNKKSLQC